MDTIDKKLVSILVKNARIPLKQLAAEIFLSSPAAFARLERLEQEGIITGYHAGVNRKRLGYNITAFVNVAMLPEHKGAFASFVESCPNVLECHHVAGQYSMLLKVCFGDTQELSLFISDIQRFGSTQTQVVFSTLVPPREVL